MRSLWLAALLPLALMGCDDTIFEAPGGEVPTGVDGYEAVLAVADTHCLGCHSAASALGDLDLESDLHDATVAVEGFYGLPIVDPGSLETSMLYLKIANQQGDGDGTEMPPGSGGLSAPEIDLVGDWILDGAPRE